MTENPTPIAYPIEDVPAVAGVSRTRVFQAARRRELIVRKAGRASVVMHDDLVAWIKSLPISRKPMRGESARNSGTTNSERSQAATPPARGAAS
jgi:hypothetical protein